MDKIKKNDEKKIMNILEKAGDSENYETSWNESGVPHVIKKKSEIKKGKKSRAKGTAFELKVRKDLESKGRVVDKWNNNVDLEKNKLVQAKRKYNPFKKVMVIGTGFPDFISIKHVSGEMYSVIGVEVKVNGILSKEEKEKCAWYIKNKVFSQIWVARQIKKGNKTEVIYDDFIEKYGERHNKT